MKKTVILLTCILTLTSWCHAWQQRVAYDIDVKLDNVKHALIGTEHLRYWNNSPDTLTFVWFHLYPNAYKNLSTALAKDAERYHDYRGLFLRPSDRGDINIGAITGDGAPLALAYGDDITEAKVLLPRPLPPRDSIDFDLAFTVVLPKITSRLGHNRAHYEISQWYPKIVVYDEKGWHPDGYHYIGEFYGDYGSFNVGITTPRGMRLGATGVEIADSSDTDQQINDSTEYHLFCAENVHDFAWCADAQYVVTEDLHNGVQIKIMTLPQDTVKWRHVMQYATDALDYYGRWYGAYPYQTLTVCDGSMAAGGGMEYPNLVIISSGEDRLTRTLEMAVIHEVGHQWFYGLLGNNEMDEAWLDEGINSFSEQRYFEEKYGSTANILASKFAQRLLPDLTDRYFDNMFDYAFTANKMGQPVLSRACTVCEPALYADIAYYKPARIVWWLRQYLGDPLFDRAMRSYVARYQYRHVTTDNFIAVMESTSHKDVRPYLVPLLTTTQRCDYAIASITRVKQQQNMYQIRLQRRDSLVLPVALRLEDRINKHYTVNWSGAGRDTAFYLQLDGALRNAVLDPDAALPLTGRYRDHWPRQWSFTLLPRLPTPDKYQVFWVPVPWYDGVNGFRLGPYLHGGYMVDGGPMLGQHQWTFAPYWGFKSRALSYSFDYQTPVTGLPMPPRLYLSLGKAYDIEWASLGLRRSWGRMLMAPSDRFDVHLDYNSARDVHRFWDPRDIDAGRNFILTAENGYIKSAYSVRSNMRVAASVGIVVQPRLDINNFFRAELEEKASLWITRFFRPHLRAIAGFIQGPAPAQEQYFQSGAFKAAGIENMIISYQGWFSAQEHYHIDGGANLPGYLGRHLRGKSVAAINLELPVHPTPLSLFAGAGQIVDSWSGFDLKATAANAGVTVQLPYLRLLLPLWINRPEPGHKRFDWRWQISFARTFSIG